MQFSFCGSPKNSNETEALHYSVSTFWVQTPPVLGWQTRNLFIIQQKLSLWDSVPHFVRIHSRVSRSWGLLFLKNTVFSLHGRFPQTALLLGMLQGFYLWDLWDHRFLKSLPNFLFRNWKLSLLSKKSKVGSVISFPVWFHLIFFLSLINYIINQFPLLITLILMTELKGLFIYKYMVFSCALFFSRNLVHKFRRNWYTCPWGKIS